MTASPARSSSGGVSLDVEVKVRASRTAVLGIRNGRLSVALAAPPVDGAANEALRRALADFFDVPRQAVQLAAGERSRRKRVELSGLTLEQALARIGALGEG